MGSVRASGVAFFFLAGLVQDSHTWLDQGFFRFFSFDLTSHVFKGVMLSSFDIEAVVVFHVDCFTFNPSGDSR